MPSIPNIPSNEIQIRRLDIPEISNWDIALPVTTTLPVPVTVQLGTPIVDIPGCVEAHESNNKNERLLEDDPRGVLTFCDGNIPSFNPPNFEPNQKLPTPKANYDTRQKQEKEQVIDAAGAATRVNTIKCKPDEQLNLQLNRCEKLVEEVPAPEPEVPWTQKYLPDPGQVTTTAAIAVVATTSALMAKPLADILLKLVKPTVKKVVKKIAKIRGKQEILLSVAERQAEQRERNRAIAALKSLKVKAK